ncbi:MAG: glycosyltransferase, partial [Candidatus Aenigmatarchaeota archaeon]
NIILTIGFWRKNKNLPLLIEVFDEIKKVFKKLKLVVVGTSHPNFPGYLEKIKEKYKNRKDIIFTGYLEDKELEKIIKKAALIVLPYTVSTGSSGVVHIVSSFGKPIIMSMLPETEEMIKEEGFYIITVPVNNKEELKRAIIKVLKNKSLQKRIAEKNLKAAEKQSFSKLAEKYIKIYKSLINSS